MAGAVKLPQSQMADPDDMGAPLSVSHAVIGYMVPTKFYDNMGKPHTEMVFVVGDVVYRDPNGERWAAGLRVLSDKVAEQIKERVQADFRSQVIAVLRSLGVAEATPTRMLEDVDVLADDIHTEVGESASPLP